MTSTRVPWLIAVLLLSPACDRLVDEPAPTAASAPAQTAPTADPAPAASRPADAASKAVPAPAAAETTKVAAGPKAIAEPEDPPQLAVAPGPASPVVPPPSKRPEPGEVLDDTGYPYGPIAFDIPLPLTLEVPARPDGQRWARVTRPVPRAKLAKALGFQTTDEPSLMDPDLMPAWFTRTPDHNAMEYDDELGLPAPFVWWPLDEAILVIPILELVHDTAPVFALILARKDGAGWKGSKVSSWIDTHEQFVRRAEPDAELTSAVSMRDDQRALYILTHIKRSDVVNAQNENACVMRWGGDAMVWACTESIDDGRM